MERTIKPITVRPTRAGWLADEPCDSCGERHQFDRPRGTMPIACQRDPTLFFRLQPDASEAEPIEVPIVRRGDVVEVAGRCPWCLGSHVLGGPVGVGEGDGASEVWVCPSTGGRIVQRQTDPLAGTVYASMRARAQALHAEGIPKEVVRAGQESGSDAAYFRRVEAAQRGHLDRCGFEGLSIEQRRALWWQRNG